MDCWKLLAISHLLALWTQAHTASSPEPSLPQSAIQTPRAIFQAHVSSHKDVNSPALIPFNVVEVDNDGGFNKDEGVYECNGDRWLLLAWSVAARCSSCVVELRVAKSSDAPHEIIYTGPRMEENAIGTSSASTLAHCQAGYKFWLSVSSTSVINIRGSLTTFSGYQISTPFEQPSGLFTGMVGTTIERQDRQKLSFDNTTLNEGAAYDRVTSSYVCEQAGVHVVSVSLHAVSGGVQSFLVHQGKLVTGPYSHHATSSYAGTASQISLVDCKEGDRISVESKGPGTFSAGLTTLSVFLLSTDIAFMAKIATSDTPIPYGKVIEFSAVEVNIGDGYSMNFGHFKCPRAGLYFLSWLIHSTSWLDIELIKEQQVLLIGPQQRYSSTTPSVSTQAIVRCEQNEDIWLIAPGEVTGTFKLDERSSFMGFALTESDTFTTPTTHTSTPATSANVTIAPTTKKATTLRPTPTPTDERASSSSGHRAADKWWISIIVLAGLAIPSAGVLVYRKVKNKKDISGGGDSVENQLYSSKRPASSVNRSKHCKNVSRFEERSRKNNFENGQCTSGANTSEHSNSSTVEMCSIQLQVVVSSSGPTRGMVNLTYLESGAVVDPEPIYERIC